jgi:ABC-type proline/glycine betaine transport system substrate-binding protein
MKRKIFIGGALFLIALAFNSCEVLNDCKTCKQVTYVNGAWDHETSPADYCGASLLAIEAMDDVINGDARTKWECN